ncbi:hypothetical protein B7463_g5353, partial [Scytalidium lignicola]
MRIRLRGPSGAVTISLDEKATVGDVISQIVEKTGVETFDVKYGYPPKPLGLEHIEKNLELRKLDVNLNGEQLTISPRDTGSNELNTDISNPNPQKSTESSAFPSMASNRSYAAEGKAISSPVSLQKKSMEGEVPELPLPNRGATLVLRVMPDDNSCLFRAFGTAVLPGDDLSMYELRSLVASAIQAQPDVYSKVVLEKEPDDYCRWIQTDQAWGGAIELGILASHFDIEICSIDVQSLRVDKFNEGRPTRCILVYSGIHYDTIVQSPSDPPHLKADNPPEFDKRVWDSDDEEILTMARVLCQKLQEKHYFTDTAGMAIRCNICGVIVHGETAAASHAQETNHYDMAEVT